MLVLDTTTKKIEAVMSGAAATTNPDFVATYADNDGTSLTEGSNDGSLNGVTDVTLVAAPGASTQRIIKSIYIENRDTADVTVTIKYDNNGTDRTIAEVTLAAGDTWTLDSGTYNSDGALKQSGGGGGGISNAYDSMTDGTTTASANGTDTFKFRSANSILSTTVQNNDATHGDNLLITVDETAIDHDNLLNFVANEHIDWTTDQGATNIDKNNISLNADDIDDSATTNKFADATSVAAAGAVMDSDISEGEGFLRKTGAGAYEAIKSNLAASAAPAATDDTSSGYAVGSRWIDTTNDKEYVCLDATATAAVWTETTGGGGGGQSPFYAVVDNLTDLVTELSNANTAGGGKVHLVAGNYTMTENITVSANVVLSGDGLGTKVTMGNYYFNLAADSEVDAIYFYDPTNSTYGAFTASHDVTVRNCYIYVGSTGKAFHTQGQRLRVLNMYGTTNFVVANIDLDGHYCLLQGCSFEVGFKITVGGLYNRIQNNYIYNYLDDTIYLDSGGNHTQITGNNIYGGNDGGTKYPIHVSNATADDSVISNNMFRCRNTSTTAIYFANVAADNTVISNNHFNDGGTGINISGTSVNNTLIVGNNFSDMTTGVSDTGTGTVIRSNIGQADN